MHPGPVNRGVELCDAVMDYERSLINQQVENGIAARMAVLYWLKPGTEEVESMKLLHSQRPRRVGGLARMAEADVLVEDGVIRAVAAGLPESAAEGARVIDAAGPVADAGDV